MSNDRLNPPWHHRRHAVLVKLRRTLEAFIETHLGARGGLKLLDYGCGDCCYRPLFAGAVDEYVGADLPGNPLADRTIADNGVVPAAEGEFDVVLSTQVLEHVVHVDRYLAECRRLLKPEGRLLLSTHGLWMYHPHPVDLWRWTGPGLERELTRNGFDVIEQVGVIGLAPAALQLFQDGILQNSLVSRLPTPVQAPIWIATQRLVWLLDRPYSPAARNSMASVHVVVARPSGASE